MNAPFTGAHYNPENEKQKSGHKSVGFRTMWHTTQLSRQARFNQARTKQTNGN